MQWNECQHKDGAYPGIVPLFGDPRVCCETTAVGLPGRFSKGFLLTLEELKTAPGLQDGSEARARWLLPFFISLPRSLQAAPHDGSLPGSKSARLSYRGESRSGLRNKHAIQVVHTAHLTEVITNKMTKLGNLWIPPVVTFLDQSPVVPVLPRRGWAIQGVEGL